ncbi:MAG: AAA family ATPase [Candidatus Omnitrophica bacterium]|nr:AAA family ATPase [Candidatus Omnitrophota bacterium]
MRKFFMYFKMYRMGIIIGGVALLLVVGTIIGLMSLESFYRNMTIATMPLTILIGGVHAFIFAFVYMYMFSGRGFAKFDKAPIKGKDIDVKWEDVIGMEDAKEEAAEIVQLVKDRTRLIRIGGKVIRGLLMVGPPGCGKTYLAKAIATEARLPFISMSGSEFVEIFVGVGASRVRKLFAKARALAYGYGGCIIFIDELDAIGKKRTLLSWGGGGQETNTTQNQLLVEMDGLGEKGGNIIVIGATNAPEDTLDKALLRPGRFDRKIYIGLPNLEDREKIFKYYFKKVKCLPDLDIGRLARRGVYKSPADIMNIVMESALIATRKGNELISMKEISEAFERIELGLKHRLTMTAEERSMTAYRESGHLIVSYLLHPTEDVFKASIIPRRGALGMVWSNPKEELHTWNKKKLLADIKVSLGGYVAEKLVFKVTSSGVSSDFTKAMNLAHGMVWNWGMGDSGYVGDYTEIPSGGEASYREAQLSDEIKAKLNNDTQKILQTCLKEVETLLESERVTLDRFARELVDKEELEYDEIDAIFKEYGKTHI